MRIVLAGGSGLLGSALTPALTGAGHEVVVLSRRRAPALPPGVRAAVWNPGATTPDTLASALGPFDAIVNLAGESIAAKRWSDAHKYRLRESRLTTTSLLVDTARRAAAPPRVLVNASAVGYYGSRGDEVLTEDSAPGADFLAGLAVEWEQAAMQAASFTRVVTVRSGIVLDRHKGALPQMMLPFRLFVGGPAGSGRQYMSWIHRDDWVGLVVWALDHAEVAGPLNATAPAPATNAEFSAALGRAMGRPSWLPAPAFGLRLALGEMADALLLSSQRAVPARAQSLGFRFRYADLPSALTAVLRD